MGARRVPLEVRGWLSISEAAAYVRTSPANIRSLVADGAIPSYPSVTMRLGGRPDRVIAKTDLNEYMRSEI